MRNKLIRTRTRRSQGGYALLLVVFLIALVVVGTMSIGLRVLTEGRREKEQEMIWRGRQYTRGVKLYYRKLGRFPTSMDDLVKPKVGNLRFMRQAYKDPMNKEDGSWRLIYVGPAGQLIGSLKPPQAGIQMPTGGGLAAPGSSSGTFGSQPAAGGISPAGGAFGASAGAPGAAGTPANGAAPGTGTGASGTDAAGNSAGTGAGTDAQTGLMANTPTIMGGSIIGVGSKVNKASVMVYEKAQNYRLFEFIWDPSKDVGIVSSPGAPIGTPAGTPNGTANGMPGQSNPLGTQPSPQPNPLNPQPLPPTSSPNSPPTPQ